MSGSIVVDQPFVAFAVSISPDFDCRGCLRNLLQIFSG